jgi:Ribonucleases G and E
MKKILLNASQKEEVRLAVVENNQLTELDIDFPLEEHKVEHIPRGYISS